ncbi:hypothetical protein [Nonomuraea guangzhouensis]|uniref:Helix-turn-helix domain-containing protein n=1 Tax=Nonomuraea guangzhouensis TaxID=1291555 RepID=A0ABW4G4S4_9ACTN|nr:hypothetical protein [Nonomuraea guangzhouensis]
MSPGRRWQDVKAEAHRLCPQMVDPQRQAAANAHLDAYVAGYRLKELRKVAAAQGTSQARVHQIENGDLN